VNPANGNVFELEMSSALFSQRDATKTLKVNTIVLLARCTDPGNYDVMLTPPLAGSNTMILAKSNTYGGLHFGQKDVTASGIDRDRADRLTSRVEDQGRASGRRQPDRRPSEKSDGSRRSHSCPGILVVVM
jgi:hypothetical protein